MDRCEYCRPLLIRIHLMVGWVSTRIGRVRQLPKLVVLYVPFRRMELKTHTNHSEAMEGIVQTVFAHPWLSLLGVYLCWHAARAIYLIYLSPLAIFPGSKWAALGE